MNRSTNDIQIRDHQPGQGFSFLSGIQNLESWTELIHKLVHKKLRIKWTQSLQMWVQIRTKLTVCAVIMQRLQHRLTWTDLYLYTFALWSYNSPVHRTTDFNTVTNFQVITHILKIKTFFFKSLNYLKLFLDNSLHSLFPGPVCVFLFFTAVHDTQNTCTNTNTHTGLTLNTHLFTTSNYQAFDYYLL